MKRLIALWLAALMLAAQPLQAAVCVGFGQSVAPTYFLSDTFTEASDTALASHTPEIGGTWVSGVGTPIVYSTGVLKNTAAGNGMHHNNVSPGSANYTVTTKIVLNTSLNTYYGGAAARVQSDKSGYVCLIAGGGGAMIFRRVSDGGYGGSALDSDTISGFGSTTEYTIAFTVNGSTLSCNISPGDISMTATDTNISAAGYAGVFFIGGQAHIDSVTGGL